MPTGPYRKHQCPHCRHRIGGKFAEHVEACATRTPEQRERVFRNIVRNRSIRGQERRVPALARSRRGTPVTDTLRLALAIEALAPDDRQALADLLGV